MKIIKISVQDFAQPLQRRGSLDVTIGSPEAMQKGIELHLARQKVLKKQSENYQAEKKVSAQFERGEYKIVIEGRMDGFFRDDIPKIEEIKTTMNLKELAQALKEGPYLHPYGLQLLSYGYFHWMELKTLPELTFHLVSTRNKQTQDLKIDFDPEVYGIWIEKRLNQIYEELILARKRSKRRQKLRDLLAFPFENPRSGQIELIQFIEDGIKEGKRLLLQAPTGLGKTMGVLFPSLKEALERGQRVVYITPKNSQQLVAEEAVERIQQMGCKVKSLTLTAKSKICMKEEVFCHPAHCEFAKDYYDKLHQHQIIELLKKKKKFSSRTFKRLAEEFKVCPFELQFESVAEAEVIIGDYNHVFATRSAFGRINLSDHAQSGNPNLVIDEAHNIPARTMAQYSPALGYQLLSQIKDEWSLPEKLKVNGEGLISQCLNLIRSFSTSQKREIEIEIEVFQKINESIRIFLNSYLESDVAIRARDPVLRLANLWSDFTDALEFISEGREEFFVSHIPDATGGYLKITCCDASELIKPKYENFKNIVAFSATIKPFDYYAQLSGLKGENYKSAEFISPFEKKNRKIILIPQVSTKFSDREQNYGKIAESIQRIVTLKAGNYLAFFPSFDFLEKTCLLLNKNSDLNIIKQKRSMRVAEVESILTNLKRPASPTLLCAVQGGIFSEGIDYPGEMIIGAFVIGAALPNFDFERERMRSYYETNYKEGFDYAYAYPAMSKAVQAAGRVIRSEVDQGIIVLMDSRFLSQSYSKSMPLDWFVNSPQEMVSTAILSDLNSFWDSIRK